MTDSAQRALREIENAGLLSSDVRKARAFAVQVATLVAPSLPEAAQRALTTVGAYLAGAATENELAAARDACVSESVELGYLRAIVTDPQANAYKLAWGAVAFEDEFQYMWQFLGRFLELAVKAGIDSNELADQLRNHYATVTWHPAEPDA